MCKIYGECNLEKVPLEPYKCPDHNWSPFFLENTFSDGKLFNNFTEGHTTWKAVIEKYNSGLSRHHKINS